MASYNNSYADGLWLFIVYDLKALRGKYERIQDNGILLQTTTQRRSKTQTRTGTPGKTKKI